VAGLRTHVTRYGTVRVLVLLGIAVLLLAGVVLAVAEQALVLVPVLLLLGCIAVLVVHDGRSLRKLHQKQNRIQALVAATSAQARPSDHRVDAVLAALEQARSDLAAQKDEHEAALGRMRERAGHTNAQFEWLVEQLGQLRADADGPAPQGRAGAGPE